MCVCRKSVYENIGDIALKLYKFEGIWLKKDINLRDLLQLYGLFQAFKFSFSGKLAVSMNLLGTVPNVTKVNLLGH